MKRIQFLSVLTIGLLAFISCDKEGGKNNFKKDFDTYYSEDFAEADGTVLGVAIDDIDVLYSHIWVSGDKFSKDENVSYKLMVKNTAGELTYEMGDLNYDNYPDITFTSEGASPLVYAGTYKNDKKTYMVSLPGVEERELTFNIK